MEPSSVSQENDVQFPIGAAANTAAEARINIIAKALFLIEASTIRILPEMHHGHIIREKAVAERYPKT